MLLPTDPTGKGCWVSQKSHGGDSSDGFDAELSSYRKKGKVLGPVVGAVGEMSDGVYVIAEAVAVQWQRSSSPITAASTLTRRRVW